MMPTVEDDDGLRPLPAARRRRILDLLVEHEYVTVNQIQAVLGVSPSTVHRDLVHLERSGVIRRLHGGATRPEHPPINDLADLRLRLLHAAGRLQSADIHATCALLRQTLAACERMLAPELQ
jgi:DNA-binding transcriptional ArsR family regulator